MFPKLSIMLGPSNHRTLDQPVIVSLEQLVPRDHFDRHLDGTFSLTIVRDWVAERYANHGRASIDPAVFFKFQLIMFFEGIRSERQLVETASLIKIPGGSRSRSFAVSSSTSSISETSLGPSGDKGWWRMRSGCRATCPWTRWYYGSVTNILVDQVCRTVFRCKRHPKRVIVNAKYASATNIQSLETAGIQTYVPLPEWDKSSTRFKQSGFTYDPEHNVYRCPQGDELVPRWFDAKREQRVYRGGHQCAMTVP